MIKMLVLLAFFVLSVRSLPVCRCEAFPNHATESTFPTFVELYDSLHPITSNCTITRCNELLSGYTGVNLTTTQAHLFDSGLFEFDDKNLALSADFEVAPTTNGCDPKVCCCANNDGYAWLGAGSFTLMPNSTEGTVSVVGNFLSIEGNCGTHPNGVYVALDVQVFRTAWVKGMVDDSYGFLAYPDGTYKFYNTLHTGCIVEAVTPLGAAKLGLLVGGSLFAGFLLIAGVVWLYLHRKKGSYQVIN